VVLELVVVAIQSGYNLYGETRLHWPVLIQCSNTE